VGQKPSSSSQIIHSSDGSTRAEAPSAQPGLSAVAGAAGAERASQAAADATMRAARRAGPARRGLRLG
jgi:hypothetical protein